MSKYDALRAHLSNLTQDEWRASFADIERAVGFRLPPSARSHPAWWANDERSSSRHASAWLKAGWRTAELSLAAETVVLRRIRPLHPRSNEQPQRSLYARTDAEASLEANLVGDERAAQAPAANWMAASSAPKEFELLAGRVMSTHFGTSLSPRRHAIIAKTFDLASEDWSIVGDAKFYTLVGGERLPPAKFATIAEHVWLLEKTGAKHAFLVFGNDRRVPVEWLKRYGNLVEDVTFYFIDDAERLEVLAVSEESSNKRQAVDHMIAGSKLEQDFHRQMLGIYRSAASELGYRATRFLQFVNNRGGLQAAKELLRRSGHPEGLTMLWQHNRLDLSMEALVLRTPWSQLFTKEQLSVACRRLRELEYNGPELRSYGDFF